MKSYIVITGASSGIGFSAAKGFAKRGKNLILIARRENKLLELKAELLSESPKLDIVIKPFDLTESEKLESLFQELEPYFIEAWINNAGFGMYSLVSKQEVSRVRELLHLNVEALTILSTLYVQKYHDMPDTQLINISSAGGYIMVPTAVAYCASKFYVSSFTEALGLELQKNGFPMRAKVLAPAATETEFGKVANHVDEYDYDAVFPKRHSSDEMAEFLLQLYDSDEIVGSVDRETFQFKLCGHQFKYGGNSHSSQKTGGNNE